MVNAETKRILITEHAPERSEGIPEIMEMHGLKAQLVRLHLGEILPQPSELDAVISGGGPMGTYEMHLPQYDFLKREADFLNSMIDQNKVVLGICFGHQLLAHLLGAIVQKSPTNSEYGWAKVSLVGKNQLFDGIDEDFWTFQYHQDALLSLPEGSTSIAKSEKCAIQAFMLKTKPVWGIQFHPEITPEKAAKILNSRKEVLEAEGINVDGSIAKGQTANHAPRLQIFANLSQIIQTR